MATPLAAALAADTLQRSPSPTLDIKPTATPAHAFVPLQVAGAAGSRMPATAELPAADPQFMVAPLGSLTWQPLLLTGKNVLPGYANCDVSPVSVFITLDGRQVLGPGLPAAFVWRGNQHSLHGRGLETLSRGKEYGGLEYRRHSDGSLEVNLLLQSTSVKLEDGLDSPVTELAVLGGNGVGAVGDTPDATAASAASGIVKKQDQALDAGTPSAERSPVVTETSRQRSDTAADTGVGSGALWRSGGLAGGGMAGARALRLHAASYDPLPGASSSAADASRRPAPCPVGSAEGKGGVGGQPLPGDVALVLSNVSPAPALPHTAPPAAPSRAPLSRRQRLRPGGSPAANGNGAGINPVSRGPPSTRGTGQPVSAPAPEGLRRNASDSQVPAASALNIQRLATADESKLVDGWSALGGQPLPGIAALANSTAGRVYFGGVRSSAPGCQPGPARVFVALDGAPLPPLSGVCATLMVTSNTGWSMSSAALSRALGVGLRRRGWRWRSGATVQEVLLELQSVEAVGGNRSVATAPPCRDIAAPRDGSAAAARRAAELRKEGSEEEEETASDEEEQEVEEDEEMEDASSHSEAISISSSSDEASSSGSSSSGSSSDEDIAPATPANVSSALAVVGLGGMSTQPSAPASAWSAVLGKPARPGAIQKGRHVYLGRGGAGAEPGAVSAVVVVDDAQLGESVPATLFSDKTGLLNLKGAPIRKRAFGHMRLGWCWRREAIGAQTQVKLLMQSVPPTPTKTASGAEAGQATGAPETTPRARSTKAASRVRDLDAPGSAAVDTRRGAAQRAAARGALDAGAGGSGVVQPADALTALGWSDVFGKPRRRGQAGIVTGGPHNSAVYLGVRGGVPGQESPCSARVWIVIDDVQSDVAGMPTRLAPVNHGGWRLYGQDVTVAALNKLRLGWRWRRDKDGEMEVMLLLQTPSSASPGPSQTGAASVGGAVPGGLLSGQMSGASAAAGNAGIELVVISAPRGMQTSSAEGTPLLRASAIAKGTRRPGKASAEVDTLLRSAKRVRFIGETSSGSEDMDKAAESGAARRHRRQRSANQTAVSPQQAGSTHASALGLCPTAAQSALGRPAPKVRDLALKRGAATTSAIDAAGSLVAGKRPGAAIASTTGNGEDALPAIAAAAACASLSPASQQRSPSESEAVTVPHASVASPLAVALWTPPAAAATACHTPLAVPLPQAGGPVVPSSMARTQLFGASQLQADPSPDQEGAAAASAAAPSPTPLAPPTESAPTRPTPSPAAAATVTPCSAPNTPQAPLTPPSQASVGRLSGAPVAAPSAHSPSPAPGAPSEAPATPMQPSAAADAASTAAAAEAAAAAAAAALAAVAAATAAAVAAAAAAAAAAARTEMWANIVAVLGHRPEGLGAWLMSALACFHGTHTDEWRDRLVGQWRPVVQHPSINGMGDPELWQFLNAILPDLLAS